jgi:hypothetical protein
MGRFDEPNHWLPLLVVLFTSMSFGVCTVAPSAAAGKLPCCADVADDQASFTACCATGRRSSTSELPFGVQVPPPAVAIAFQAPPQVSRRDRSRHSSFSAVPYASADPQALLSTFLF